MNEPPRGEALEEQLRTRVRDFPFPPTPDIATRVRVRLEAERRATVDVSRRPLRPFLPAVAVLLLFVGLLLAVPDVRAGLRSALRLGAVEIVFPTASPTSVPATPSTLSAPDSAATAIGGGARDPTGESEPSASPTLPLQAPLLSALELDGETSLEEARLAVPFPIRLPSYPADLGPPDRVFVQELGGMAAILVWLEPGSAEQVRLSIHELGDDAFAQKVASERVVIRRTTVGEHAALWVRGPHILRYRQPSRYREDLGPGRLVDGNVLIWEDATGVTYRIETTLSLEEARRIAESMR